MNDVGIVVIVLTVVVLLVVIARRAVMVVRQHQVAVIERLGRYLRLAEPGLTTVAPFIDKVRALLDLREQTFDLPKQTVTTADNRDVEIDLVIYFRVVDPVKATYEIADHVAGVERLATTTLRSLTGGTALEDVLAARGTTFASELGALLGEAANPWGLAVNRVEPKQLKLV